MHYIQAAVGLTIGNFFYQAIANQNYAKALELSVFQCIAVLVVFLCSKP